MAIESINPATGKRIRSYPELTPAQVRAALEQTHRASVRWKGTAPSERTDALRAVGAQLRRRADEFAVLMAQEMGKPVAQGRSEAEKCAWVCEYYAEHGGDFLAPQPIATDAAKSFVAFEPLGVILAVMPWNFPFWQVFRAAAPALMAGNGMVLKHASNVPGCALAIEEVLRQSGVPDGVFRTLLVESAQIPAIIDHPVVKAVTLTGSTPAGQAVASRAGAALKKTVLELGGSDPYVILEDADLDLAVETCVASRLINAGQSCIAAKRFIVVEEVRKAFEDRMVHLMRQWKVGDPMDETVQVGPLARHDLRDELRRQVQTSMKQGARLLLGGSVPESPGAFYPPTVLTDVRKGMPAYDEELFGPVAAIIPVQDEADAIRVANDTPFGLGAAVFTRDLAKGERIATYELEAGSCFVNAFVKSDPRLPFGGIKRSGYGRELSSVGIREFVNIKTVYIK